MKEESGKRFSKLKAFAKDAFASQDYDYRDDEYYQDDEDSYDKASQKNDFDYDDKSTSYSSASTGGSSLNYSSYSSQPSYKSSYSSSSTSSANASFGYSSYSDSTSSTLYKVDNKSKFRLSILRLEKLDDAVKVADEIMSGNTITLVDLRCVQKETVRRIIDFLDGVRYTCEAKMEIVADYTYVVVPKDVELSGDLFSQIDTSSLS